LNGKFTIDTDPGKGVAIACNFPIAIFSYTV